ncbi:RNA polymerase I-specific transcription initiation factor-domain-containing protein [Xylaria venustula]|nr:RNA polymerase I-specific transcription initiation factor-domain-containing protein [Xylaria venustula]
MAYESDEYLPDSEDESNNAEEEQRPNRWTGPPSTWQQLNSAEINTLTALNEIRNRDLAVHLYNAFALRHRRGRARGGIGDGVGPVAEQDVDVATGQPVQDTKWVPPNAWTAWPLPANAVPRPGFMGPAEEADDAFTFKMRTPYEPRAELEETLSAAMLRLAKERFQARPDEETVTSERASSADEQSDAEMSSRSGRANPRAKSKGKGKSKARSRTRSVKYESTSEGAMMDVDDDDADVDMGTRKQKKRSTSTLQDTFPLKTVVATDDELSYTLLRPSVRGLIAKLDTALSILHNAQESKINCPSESSGSDASSRSLSRSRSRSRSRGASVARTTHSRSPVKRRQQPRSSSRAPSRSRASSTALESAPEDSKSGKKRRGRPRKIYPQHEGETERDYAIRVARLRKERLPIFADVDDDNITTNDDNVSDSGSGRTPIKSRNKGKGKGKGKEKVTPKARSRTRHQRRDSETTVSSIPETSDTSSTPRHRSGRRPQLGRVRLRDWRDILGAAALAGFPPAALDRAARRCADLFGQSFAMHTLYEGPVERRHDTDKRVQYEPGMIIPVSSDSDDGDEGGWGEVARMSRATSAAPSERNRSRSRSRSVQQPRSRSRSISQSRSRSRSASTAGGAQHYCIFSNCPRATDPFDRRPNLTRHYRLIHNYEPDEEISAAEDVESQDEMYGAVHVDGFLRPIKMRPGWKGEDTAREKRRSKRRVGRAEGDLSD